MGVKPGFMVYHKAADLLCNLPDEACGILFKSLVLYSRDGVTSDFSEHPFSVFLDAIFSEQKKLMPIFRHFCMPVRTFNACFCQSEYVQIVH